MSTTTNPRQNQISGFGKPSFQSSGPQQQKRRPGGGWEEGNDEMQLKNVGNTYGDNRVRNQDSQNSPKEEVKPLSGLQSSPKLPNSLKLQVEDCNENFLAAHEYESKIINEIIQPGGARVKQPDSTLLDFCNTCEHLDPSTVGSILLSKFNEQIEWISKARVIFAIEALSKKFSRYFDYFKHNIDILQKVGFTQEGMKAIQLRNLMDSLIRTLNHPAFSAQLQKENQVLPKPSVPTLPHNNSQGEPSKPKTEQKTTPILAVKASSLPSGNAGQEKSGPNFVNLRTAKEKSPVKNESVQLLETSTPTSANASVNANSNLKIPLDQGNNNIANFLSDIDFSGDGNKDNAKSPNNIYNLYKGPSPINYYGATSPTGFVGNYSPAYYNYPASNSQMQGSFNSYVQANSAPHQNNNFGQYGNNDIFNQPTGIDYNKEETEKQKKREEIEKRFESLNF